MKIAAAALAAVLGLTAASHAVAEPGLGEKVYDPYVRNGLTEVEVRAASLTGGRLDGESGAVVELEHGFSDRVSLAVLGEFEHHAGERSKLDSIAVEGVVYLGQVPRLGLDVGAYLEYEQRIHNESGVAEAKLLLARQFGPVQGLLNLIAHKPLTNKHGEGETQFGYAAQGTVEAAPGLRLGVEAFGDAGTTNRLGGRNPHYVGPTVQWETRPAWLGGADLDLNAGYLFAAGAARDYTKGQMRLNLELERRF